MNPPAIKALLATQPSKEHSASPVKNGNETSGENLQLLVENGEVVELQSPAQTMTTPGKIEQRLLDSEQRYRSLFNAGPHPMWVYDPHSSSFLAVNDAAIQTYGYSASEFRSMIVTDIEFNKPAVFKVAGCRREGRRHVKKDFSLLDVEVTSVPVVFEGREAELVTATDVTAQVQGQTALAIERERGEQALLEANRKAINDYEHLLQRITTLAESFGTARDLPTICRGLHAFALASCRPADRILVWSYDCHRDEHQVIYACCGKDELVLTRSPVICTCEGPHSRALRSGDVVVEHRLQSQADTPPCRSVVGKDFGADCFSLVTPMLTKGVVTGAVEIQSERTAAFSRSHITAMQMAANLAANAIENVRLLESEREKEEQLRQSQKMEAVGQLAGGVAHDFNNLITAINGYADMALRRLDPDAPVRKHLGEIKKAGNRAASLTRQLLTFSRKQALQTSIFSLNSVVGEMQGLMRRLIGEDIELIASLAPSLGNVKADASQVENLILNLVVNARDALIGGGRITIETANVYFDDLYARNHHLPGAGSYVMLGVTDTGIGMDAATQSRIFEPFFTTKDVGKGTGLGLSMVYGAVKQNGGHLSLHSEVGVGTSFKVYLPEVELVAERRETDNPLIVLGTETIVLVEDEQLVRKLARHILEASGYTVFEATNGAEAIELCKGLKRPPDLLLTDVVMPKMSGPALVEEIVKFYPDMSVLYMSGYTDQLRLYGLETEGLAFLQKPFSPDLLASKVRETLDAGESKRFAQETLIPGQDAQFPALLP